MTLLGDRVKRREIADVLRSEADTIARSVTDEFLRRHPDWIDRYGPAARTRGEEDAEFHLKFLTGAILSGSVSSFEDYARWTAGVLDARGIAPAFLAENLEQVGGAARETLSEEESRAVVDRLIDAAVEAVKHGGVGVGGAEPSDGEWSTELSLYLQAIRSGEREAAVNIVNEALRQGASVPEVYQHILQPAQYELGRLWERNEITVATEHMATAVTQYVISQLYMSLELPDRRLGNAIVTGVSGELHQIGALMVSDMLTAAGWNARFLGTQLPHPDIVAAVEDHEAGLVGISTTVLANLSAVSDLIEKLRARFGEEVTILVGGGAYRSEPEIWREVGADAFGRDLADAVKVASTYVADEA